MALIGVRRDGVIWAAIGKDSLFKYGDTWRREGPPSADDLKDNFSPLSSDSAEFATLLHEAEAWSASNPILVKN